MTDDDYIADGSVAVADPLASPSEPASVSKPLKKSEVAEDLLIELMDYVGGVNKGDRLAHCGSLYRYFQNKTNYKLGDVMKGIDALANSGKLRKYNVFDPILKRKVNALERFDHQVSKRV